MAAMDAIRQQVRVTRDRSVGKDLSEGVDVWEGVRRGV